MGSIPPAFAAAHSQYLADIENNRAQIESAFQLGLNEDFVRLFWFYTLLSLAGIILLAGLPSKKEITARIAEESGGQNY